jgi:hypothetical protein
MSKIRFFRARRHSTIHQKIFDVKASYAFLERKQLEQLEMRVADLGGAAREDVKWRAFITSNQLRLWLPDDEKLYRRRHDPPKYAELLLTAFASTRHGEAMIGDLNEQYAGWCEHFGTRHARWLYWARTAQSIGPLLLRWIGKALKWAAVISTVRRALGL